MFRWIFVGEINPGEFHILDLWWDERPPINPRWKLMVGQF